MNQNLGHRLAAAHPSEADAVGYIAAGDDNDACSDVVVEFVTR